METSPQVTVSVQGPLLRVSVGGRWNFDEPWPSEAATALASVAETTPGPDQLEVAILDRARPRRTFRRMGSDRLADLLGVPPGGPPAPGVAESPDLPAAGGEGP